MKRYTFTAICLLCTWALFAQENTDVSRIGIVTAQQNIVEISLDQFEFDGFWSGRISSDSGFIQVRLRELTDEGMPERRELENVPEEFQQFVGSDEHALGIRVDFLRRGNTSFTLTPRRPIPIPGVTKSISVWAVGRNFNHTLVVLIEDFHGRRFELPMGRLNFQGWKLS